jgi:hypothetical protein
MKGLVPTQVMKPLAADTRPRPKARPARNSPAVAHVVHHLDSSLPPYQSRFIKYNGMKEEMYDELDDDNKRDFIQVFVAGGLA